MEPPVPCMSPVGSPFDIAWTVSFECTSSRQWLTQGNGSGKTEDNYMKTGPSLTEDLLQRLMFLCFTLVSLLLLLVCYVFL